MVEFRDQAILAPLTKGGNLPFRRWCVDFGARVTTSEMAYARQVVRGSRSELALLRSHASEPCFGVQLATSRPEEAAEASRIAVDRGARFVDLNVGCPIHDVVRRGMGATLLRRGAALGRIVEAMAAAVPVPVTVKLRSGWREGQNNALELARTVVAAGARAVALHARSREQRYTRAADWSQIAELVAALEVPVIGNGDLLTYYEAAARQAESGCAAVMLARGALIKPWLFREIAEQRAFEPDAEARVGLYLGFTAHLREHFGEDDHGRQRALQFLTWHLDFLCRYRPLPEEEWAERAREHPLLQTRLPSPEGVPSLEAVLRDPRPAMHERLAAALWQAGADGCPAAEAAARVAAIAGELPPEASAAAEIKTAHG